jgi:threonylcarbamoyladenosine tRNA methylthiotransferase MtaB
LGCKVNQFESAAMAEQLQSLGYALSPGGPYDLLILNTCAVTDAAEKEALRLLRRLRRENPGATILATGCLAQERAAVFLQKAGARAIFGNDRKGNLKEVLEARAGALQLAAVGSGEARDLGDPALGKTRAFQKIQDGCSQNCSYCVIPQARGESRSLSLGRVLTGLESYARRGFREVVLTGIHLGNWGRDLSPPSDLKRLLAEIARVFNPSPHSFRLRLSSLEPTEAWEIRETLGEHPFVAPHLHVPLQAGTDKILALMKRPYRVAFYAKVARSLRELYPQMSLGTDFMVGFPGETEEDFAESLAFLRDLPVTYAHVFPFSARPGTPAATLPGQVSAANKKERAQRARAFDRARRGEFLQASLGREHLAIVENTPHAPSGRLKVLTGNYLVALLDAPAPMGELARVTLRAPQNPWGLAEAALRLDP